MQAENLRGGRSVIPTVSIVIPAYNPGVYLDEALQSVLAQTFGDWECLVVDDGSNEDLSRIAGLDARITLMRQPNRGVSVARNAGLLATSAPYVAFLDSDDLWLPDKLERQIELLRSRPEVALCHTAFRVLDERGQLQSATWGGALRSYSELLSSSGICLSTVMLRRSCLAASGLFDPLLRAAEDYDLWLKLARHYQLEFEPQELVHYRVHGSNASGDPDLMARGFTLVLKRHLRLAQQQKNRKREAQIRRTIRQGRTGWGSNAFDIARAQWGSNKRDAVRSIALSSRLAPFYVLQQLLLLPQRTLAKLRR